MSRIPTAQIKRVMQKDKKVMIKVQKHIRKVVPQSSKLHAYLSIKSSALFRIPATPVLCTSLELFGCDSSMDKVGLHIVFIAFLWPALLAFAVAQFAVKKLPWNAVGIHPDGMTCPSKLGFQDHGFDACSLGSVKDLKVCDLVSPPDAEDRPEAAHVEAFQQFNVLSVQWPRLTSV